MSSRRRPGPITTGSLLLERAVAPAFAKPNPVVWVPGRASLARDDSEFAAHRFSFSRHDLSELCNFVAPSEIRGRREGRAPTAPAATGVQWVAKKRTRLDRYSRDIPAFPAMFDGLYVLSPVSALIVTVAEPAQAGRIDATVAAPGTHDFAVRCSVSSARLLALTPQASIATRATHRDDRETSLWRHGLATLYRKSEFW